MVFMGSCMWEVWQLALEKEVQNKTHKQLRYTYALYMKTTLCSLTVKLASVQNRKSLSPSQTPALTKYQSE